MSRRVTSAAVCLSVAALAGCAGDAGDTRYDPAVTFATVPPVTTTIPAPPTTSGPETTGAPTTGAPAISTTVVPVGPLIEPTVALVEVGQFDEPVDIAVRPLDNRLFVIEQPGRIVAVDDVSTQVVLDISDLVTTGGSEQGLLGLAFHPELDRAYVNYTDTSGDTVVAEFAVDRTTAVFDPASFREVLTVDQPFRNHNGGKLEFGPDRYLYIGLGDGGSGGDPGRVALDLSSRLGKILRIDPTAGATTPFTVPEDNPFVGTDGADGTIWAAGLRNPWRFSFDPVTGDLWVADVGQDEFEEVNRAPAVDRRDAGKGLSFGWSAFEGTTAFNGDQRPDGHTAPVHVYAHTEGRCSVSGGAVARSDLVADLAGWYVFGDYCTGEIWGLDPSSAGGDVRIVALGRLGGLAAVSLGPDRELYAIANSGMVARFAGG